jgi:hypothetical protein
LLPEVKAEWKRIRKYLLVCLLIWKGWEWIKKEQERIPGKMLASIRVGMVQLHRRARNGNMCW